MKRVRRLRWLKGLAELISCKKACEAHSMQREHILKVRVELSVKRLTHFTSTVRYLSPERLSLQPNSSLNSTPVEVEFLAWARHTSQPIAKMLRSQTSGLNSSLIASSTEGWFKSFSCCCCYFASPKTDKQKFVEKLRRFAKHENRFCRGRKKVVEVVGRKRGQFHGMMNANKSAGPNWWCAF